MKQTTLDNWNVTKTVESKSLAEKAKADEQWAEILAWEAVEMRDWI